MSSDESETAADAEEESAKWSEPKPAILRAEDDKIVAQMNSVNEELVTYTFRLLEQCITLSDAVAEINQVNLIRPTGYHHHHHHHFICS